MSNKENNTPKGQHTQGEWKVSGAFNLDITTKDGGTFIASVGNYQGDCKYTWDKQANAKLIASAPELLEALMYARNVMILNKLNTDFVNEAIKKATE